MAELLDLLRITKQSLGRVLKQLLDEDYIVQRPGKLDRRQRLMFPTEKGEALVPELAGLQTVASPAPCPAATPPRKGPPVPAAMIDRDEPDKVLEAIRQRQETKGVTWPGRGRGGYRADTGAAGRRRPASSGGRRRPPHPRPAAALSARRRLSRHDGGERQDAHAHLRGLHFDLIILDVMMPGQNGFEFAAKIRHRRSAPILMLTARRGR